MGATLTVVAAAELMAAAATAAAVMMVAMMAAIVVAEATVTATAVDGKDNGGNSNGGGHSQQSTKCGSKDMVAVVTATDTAAAGAATTDAGMPVTALGVGADRIAFATAAGAATTAMGAVCRKRSKDCLALWSGSSAHSAVLAPLVGGGACPTFPVGSRGGGGHDGRVVSAGCEGCVCWLCGATGRFTHSNSTL
jgi:hypothetical protein